MDAQQVPGKPLLQPQLAHLALLLEAILGELRYMRGLSTTEEAFRQSVGLDYQRPLQELQEQRRALFD